MAENTVVYYFTGSGNSLAVARDIAAGTGGSLVPIAAVIDEESVSSDADAIGIVFPVYHSDLPNMVASFINKAEGLDGKYVFGVCTYGGQVGLTIKYLADLVESRGGRLAAGFGVKMPFNYIGWSRRLRKIPIAEQREMFENWSRRSHEILDYITAREEGAFDTSVEKITRLADRLRLKETIGKRAWLRRAGIKECADLTFREGMRLMDHGFRYDANCDGCGICSRICPAHDIAMEDGRPSWRHLCEQCFACLHWCPREAIQFGDKTEGGRRYHHPEVRLFDMLHQPGAQLIFARNLVDD